MNDIADAGQRWNVVASRTLLEHWLITVRSDTVHLPDNHQMERTVVTHPGSVAVLALDADQRVLMIRQYRHPVGRLLWEIPAGLRDVDGEPLLATAQRELLEETGWRAGEWHVLVDYFMSPGFSTERTRIFLARDVEQVPGVDYTREDEEKFLLADWVPLADAVRLALEGSLHNGPAITGVLAAHAARSAGFSGLRLADAPEA